MNERFDFGPEFADHLPEVTIKIEEEKVEESSVVDPNQLSFFILDRFVEVK